MFAGAYIGEVNTTGRGAHGCRVFRARVRIWVSRAAVAAAMLCCVGVLCFDV